jgi:hypothetical protein
MPFASAPSTLSELSSRKSTCAGDAGSDAATRSKISRSGLTRPSSNERKRYSNASRIAHRRAFSFQCNVLVLLKHPIGVVRATSRSSASAPGIGARGQVRNEARKVVASIGRPHSSITPDAKSSDEHRPRSKSRTHGQPSQRRHSSSSS